MAINANNRNQITISLIRGELKMSPIDYTGGTLKEFGPKVGESKVIHIREARRVEDPTGQDEQNFRSMTKNFGYRFELTLTNGRIFMLNVWKLFFAFKEADVQDGDLVQIDHLDKGVYKVTVLEKGTGIGVVVEDTEKAAYDAEQAAKKGTAPAPAVAQPAPVAQVAPPVAQAPVTQPAPVAQPAVTQPVTQPPVAQPAVQAKPEEELDLPF